MSDVFVFPTSSAQQRLWFLDQYIPGNAFYNMPFVVRLSSRIDVDAITRSFDALVRRHESLRTTFAVVDDVPVQVIASSLDLRIPIVDLSGLSVEDREREAQRLAADERSCPFDLTRGPLLRVTVVRMGDAGDVLLLTLHHIVSDGWSMQVLFSELSALYEGFRNSRVPVLRELPVQYADFAVWQRQWLRDEALERQMSYWHTKLAGVSGYLELPADRPRPTTPLLGVARRATGWPAVRSDGVRALARREGSTVFLVLAAAFKVLLARYSAQTDIVVGTPIANRVTTETEPLIGFFVNTLALRTDLSGDPTFIELLERVRATAAGAFANQDVPFERVVAELAPERGVNRNPLFQVMFALQSLGAVGGVDAPAPGSSDASRWESSAGAAKFDLTMSLVDSGSQIDGWLEYASDLFDGPTIDRVLDNFGTLVDSIVAAPHAKISSLAMISSAERKVILEDWNSTETSYPRHSTITALFEEQAARRSDALAVTYADESLTYTQLNARANQLARVLRRRGAGRGALVGVLLAPSIDMIVTLLAVLKTGAAYVPLDPSDPPDRLDFMCRDGEFPVLVALSGQVHIVGGNGPDAVCLDTAARAIAGEETGNLTLDSAATDLAYVMYTSGSTGVPKGVAVPHRAVVRLVRNTNYLNFSTTRTFAQLSHPSFDAATFEVWGALLSGSSIVGIPKAVALSPNDLGRAIQTAGITTLFITTALFNHTAREAPGAFAGVRDLLTGGEAPDAAAMRSVLDASRPGRLLNAYGPTESTTFAACHHVTSLGDGETVIPIGRPVANTRAYVLDEGGQPVPIGAPGELYLGGDGVAHGYWRRPELTAERFLPDPFSPEPHAVMYRTGDRARFRQDGSLVFLGRCDEQIKIRGFRVEPGEIEAALRMHPDVSDAAVIAARAGDDTRLTAYLVNHNASRPPADGVIRAHLQHRLPSWMCPAQYVWLDALPLTPSGKIDRRALPDQAGRRVARDEGDTPATPTEQAIAGIWCELLGVDRLVADDGFFASGGHSLLAAQVISRIRDRLHVEVSIQALFAEPTLRRFAEAVDRQRALAESAPSERRQPLQRRTTASPRKTSFAQQRLWFLAELDPGSATYNIADVIPLAAVSEDFVRRALNEIVRRHEILRTTIAAVNGVPLQIVAPQHDVELVLEDCRAGTAAERSRRCAEARTREAMRPFDLARSPLFRARLLRVTDRDLQLCLTMHHSVADAWSLRVLRSELQALLDAFAAGKPSPLPDLVVQYSDYAEWQRERLESGELDGALNYWRRQLAGAPTLLELPSDRARPPVQAYAGATVSTRLAPGVVQGLAAVGEARAATTFMTLLASFAVLLARYTGQRDLVVGVPAAGRTHTELERMIGMFVNTLPIRIQLADDPPFHELLERVRQATTGAYAHQELPFDRLVAELSPARQAGISPLVQVLFDLQRLPEDRALLIPPGEVVEGSPGVAKFDLTLAVVEDMEGLVSSFEYNRDCLDAPAATRMLRNFHRLLAAVAENPGLTCSRLELVADEERQMLLREWNHSDGDGHSDRSLMSLVEAQVRRTPQALAVADGKDSLTFAEVDARACRLARRLIALGARVEQPIGVCGTRSCDFVVSLLGILRAGSACLCLESDQPVERSIAMLRNSGATLLITSRSLPAIPWPGDQTVFLEDQPPEDGRGAFPLLPADVRGSSLAAIVYTSGSTGLPKGVAIEHHSLANLVRSLARHYELTPSDRVVQMAPVAFDVAFEEIFPTLASGAAVVPWPGRAPPTIEELLAYVERFQISVLNLPSPYWHALADALERQPRALPTSLRLVIAGSDKTSFDRLAAWQQSAGDRVRWLNAYGTTEAAVTSTLYEPPVPAVRGRTPWVPVGRPIRGVRAHVLDEHRALMPAGAPGELYLGGEGIARGYLADPALTAERFIADPFAQTGDSRLYRTGDRARFSSDGSLELLGRFDAQIKVRGVRIEPAEIERALEANPAIRESVVVARSDGSNDPRLVAYVVPRQWPAPAGGDLRRLLQERLPDYMIPSAYVALRSFPTTPAGKIDRAQLPAPERSADAGRTHVPPRTPAERQLADLWAQVLGIEHVGVTDNFFELGGDSILSIQILARAAETGLHFTARQLFQHQTIAELAPLAGTARPIVAEQEPVVGPVPLTPVQGWFFEQSPIDPHHHNQSVLLRCERGMDSGLLEQAFAHLMERHDALRLRFRVEDGTAHQQSAAPGQAAFTRVDLRNTPPDAREAALERAAAECHAGLDLERGPIARACHIVLDDSGRLLIVIHHLAVDGVSWQIILRDLSTAYDRLARGESLPFHPKTTSFRQWAAHLVEYARTASLADEIPLWTDAAEHLLPLPRDYPASRADNTEASARTVHVALDRTETEALLHQAPRAYRTQVNDVLLCALARGLRSWTGAREILVDLEGHGREPLFEDVDVSRTVGWFTTIFPVLLNAGEDDAPGEALKGVKEYLRGLPNKGIGYGVLRYLHPDPAVRERLCRRANPEISFNYFGQFEDARAQRDELQVADEWSGPQRAPRAARPYLLDITGAVVDGRLSLSFMYSAALHRRTTIEALAERVAQALRSLIDHCLSVDGQDCTPSDFPLARLDRHVLARLAAVHPNIEDIYPLSPMQAGLLFHTLLSPDAGEYVEQLVLDLDPDLDVAALGRAWSAVVERHPALRAAFVWQDVDEPLQVVRQRVKLPWDVRDWSDAIDADSRAESWLRDDRRTGYLLDDPPLMRFLIAKIPTGQWRMLWSCHHLLLDGWSVPLVLREAWEFYEAFRDGREVTLAHPRPYRDYVQWISRQDLKAAEAFWRDVLRGFAAPTPLVVDSRPRDAGRGDSHGESRRTLTAATTSALQTLARRHRVTLNTIVQAVWALILSRYSGQLDVLFGATVSGRPPDLRGVEAMVGLFINTLPVRVRIAPEARVMDWLETLQEQQSAARQFEYSPLVSVQGWSDVPRGTPLFESVLVFENYPGDPAEAPDEDRDRLQLPALERTSYPLTIAVVPGAKLLIKITYDSSRLQPDAVERMLGHWETVLSAMADGADRTIASLPLLTVGETERLAARNRTAAAVPFSSCVEMFDRQALLTPDATAVESGDGSLTYAELSAAAGSVARCLRAHGVGADVPVALAVERGPWLAVGLLAILKAGGAYVPLAASYPADRIDFMLDDSGARVVVTQLSSRDRFQSGNRTVVCLDDETDRATCPPAAPLPSATSLAYIIYTSGSTGRPKGVALPHAALANLVSWQNTKSTPRRSARVAQFAPVSFDVCFQEYFSTWACGGTVVVISEDEHRDPALLARAIDSRRIDRLFVPFVALQQLAETALDSGGVLHLQELVTAGERLQITPALRRFFSARQGCTLHNQYGPSETHVATAFTLPPQPDDWPELPPIGWPIDNAQAYVLDADMRVVPDGVAGELYLGGDCVARGYWRRPGLTAERFVVNSFPGDGSSARLYRTGDLVRARPDGALEFLGRIDDQVKIRGFRVEPGEVEAVLSQHPAVGQAAVVARESRAGGPSLTAYVAPAGTVETANAEAPNLRHYLEDRLPDWMIPAAFVWMDRLPLTPSGKVNRLALPTTDGGQESDAPFEPPRTSGERALAATWSELLGVKRIGIHDHFFALGGHSLLATRMVARIRRDLGVELPLRAVFDNPVLEDLSRRLNDLDARLAQPAIIPRRSQEGPCIASFAQQRLWILEQMNASTVFHIATVVDVDGTVPAALWRRAFNEIIRRHAVLRTTFDVSDGLPVQQVSPRLEIDLPVDDLRAYPHASREAAYREIADAETTAPFDLSRGPLVRLRLVRVTEDDSRLLLTLHHIVADGWSLGILKRELDVLCAAFARGAPSPLLELPIQYAEFAEWQCERLQGALLREHVDYWRSHLAGAPPTLDFPSDRPRSSAQSYAGAMVSARLPVALLREVRMFGRQEEATLFMTLLSAFALLLSRHTAQRDLVIGAPVAGRTRAETEPLVGLFLNHLPIRINLEGSPSFRTLLRRVRDATLGAFGHQELPFERLLQALKPERHASQTPLFQVFFNLLNFENVPGDGLREDAGAAAVEISAPVETWSPFAFTLYAAERPDGLELQLVYRTSLYDADRMTELLAQFITVVNQVVQDPDRSIDGFSLVTDRSGRLVPDPSSPLDSECHASVHAMFCERAVAEPHRLAVSDDEVAWTYGELGARSASLARQLRNDGIADGDVVAIYAHRSAALVSAILGVLEVGAAYLILDPGYPDSRLEEYLNLAKPVGWIAIDRARSPGQALQDRIDAWPWCSRLTLSARDPVVDAAVEAPRSEAGPDRIACVSFTSGSTGRPRAVLQRHGGLSHFAPWATRTFGIVPDDRFTMLSGLSHDPLQRDIFTPLALGASLHVPGVDDIGTPGRLAAWIRERGITVANLTPALSQLLAGHLPDVMSDAEMDQAPTLRLVFFGGDRLKRSDIVRVRALSRDAVCVNLYGTTETQRALSCHVDAPASGGERNVAAGRELVPLGLGLPGVQLLVIAPLGQRAGVGEIGEIYVRSPHLAAGYLDDAELTAERFVTNPVSGVRGDRMYRTGDLGRYLPDGQVEFVGRADGQIKIRGFRVEPAEVEAQLVRHPRVRSAAVVVRDPANPDSGLAAYVIAAGPPTSLELRRYLAERLPDYMVPSAFVFLDALPVTPNGKLDRAALPPPAAVAVDRTLAVRGPRDVVEATLVALWRRALECSTFGIDDNFFELGGHSLLAAQVLARVADALHVNIPLGRFFDGPTIAELAAVIASAGAGEQYAARPRIEPIPRHRYQARRTEAGDLDVSPELRQIIREMAWTHHSQGAER